MGEPWVEERLLVDGQLVGAENSRTYDNVNPTTEEVAGVAADAGPGDMQRAIAAARRAFDETDWSRDTAFRAHCLRQLHDAIEARIDEFRLTHIVEGGVPDFLTKGPAVGTPLTFLPYYADLCESYDYTEDLGNNTMFGITSHRWVEREPVGVVGAITPWNFPTQINLAKVAPALAAGCTVVLKPAPDTPWSALALGQAIAEHTDIPAGVVNIVSSSDKEIGRRLVRDARVDLVSFTGSTATGRAIMRDGADTVKRLFLELGGKSAIVVLDDADFGFACMSCAIPVTVHSGQGCAITTRALLPRSRFDEGVEVIRNGLENLKYGDPMESGHMMGPLISAPQRERVEGYVRDAADGGATIVTGGRRPPQFERGFFYEPTLVVDVDPGDRIAQEEVFGPVLVAIPYEDDDDAVRIANDSIYGLSGAVFSGDTERAKSVARRIRTGTIGINGGSIYAPDAPFGGMKQSGFGREMGVAGFEEYLELKTYAEPGA